VRQKEEREREREQIAFVSFANVNEGQLKKREKNGKFMLACEFSSALTSLTFCVHLSIENRRSEF
jgi:hypothetical protein